jgi:hypothetical protein
MRRNRYMTTSWQLSTSSQNSPCLTRLRFAENPLKTCWLMFRFVFWDVLSCKIIVDRRFRGTCCLHHRPDDGRSTYLWNIGWQQYIPEDKSELRTRRRENLKSHTADWYFTLTDFTYSMQQSPFIYYDKKGKAVPLHAMEALGGRGDIVPTHSRPRH